MSLSLYHLEGACLAVGKRLHHYVYALLQSLEPCAVKAELPSSFPWCRRRSWDSSRCRRFDHVWSVLLQVLPVGDFAEVHLVLYFVIFLELPVFAVRVFCHVRQDDSSPFTFFESVASYLILSELHISLTLCIDKYSFLFLNSSNFFFPTTKVYIYSLSSNSFLQKLTF